MSIFTKIRQVAVVTRNTKQSVEKFADLLGTGIWQYFNFSPKNCKDMELYGKSAEYSMALAVCDIGNVQFEFCQPLDDRSLYAKFLREHGEGPQHIAYALDREYEEAIEYFKSKGMTVSSTGNWHGCCKFNYLTGAENFKHTPEFHKQDLVEVAKYLPDGEYPEKGLDFRGKPVLSAITRVGLVVRDLEATVGFYEKEFQMGPWERLEYNGKSVKNMKGYGQPADCRYLAASAVVGETAIKIIQPLDEKSIFAEFLKHYGEGFHHITYKADDFEWSRARFRDFGVKESHSGNVNGNDFVYFNSLHEFQHIIEIQP